MLDRIEQIKKDLLDNPNRIYYDLPAEVYHHPLCPGISASKLSLIHKSYAYYKYKTEHPERSPALDFGCALHDAILLPEVFESTYVKAIDCDRRTKVGKEKFDEFCKTAADKIIIPKDDYTKIIAMRDRVMSVEACRRMLKGRAEVSMFWIDEETGIQCKGRMDLYRDDSIILDLKTTQNASKKAFSKSIVDYGYDRAGAFYLDGITKITGRPHGVFAYIAIEKEPPFELGLYILGQRSIDNGRALYKKDLQKYIEGLKHAELKMENDLNFEVINVPDWAYIIGD